MRKAIVIVLVALAVVLLAAGAVAYMSSDTSNDDNTFATGRLMLETSPEPFMDVGGLMPGGPKESSDLQVFSQSPTRFVYRIEAGKQRGSTKLWNALKAEVRDFVTGEFWSGNLSDMTTGWFASKQGVEGGGYGKGHQLRFTAWLPQGADVGDEDTVTVRFKFEGEQWRGAK